MDRFTIPYEVIVKGKDFYDRFVYKIYDRDCLCGHIAIVHQMEIYRNAHMMQDELVFKHCRSKPCDCSMFKADNLLYLEKVAGERASL